MSRITGKVAQIIGPVVDVVFNDSNNELPKIYDSLEITKKDGTLLVLEVQSHIGENTVRTISMDSTDGLSRGAEVVATGAPIQMPIGADVFVHRAPVAIREYGLSNPVCLFGIR